MKVRVLRALQSKRFWAFCLLTLVGLVIVLEVLSRYCTLQLVTFPSCSDLSEEYGGGYNPRTFLPENYEGISVESIIESKIIYVPRSALGNLNGITCGGVAYVDESLLGIARRHVAIHEAFHIKGFTNEAQTEWKAVMYDPFGVLVTIPVIVIKQAFVFSPLEYPCVGGGLWRTFKRYFLNIETDTNNKY